MMTIKEKIFDRHDVYVNQKYGEGDSLPYSFHLKMVLAQGNKFKHLIDNSVKDNFLFECDFGSMIDMCLLGHDLIEDARMTRNDVFELFSPYFWKDVSCFIADVIYCVTDEKGINRKGRKNEKFYEELKANKYAIFVKLADMSANMLYSKSFNTPQYEMYKKELPNLINELYLVEYDEFFEYLKSL